MNCWIKILFWPILFSYAHNLHSQSETIIKVRGVSYYEIPAIRTQLEFSFEENGKTCGPNTEFETIDEQFDYFNNELLPNNSLFQFTEMDYTEDYFYQFPKVTYAYTSNMISDFKSVDEKARYAFGQNFKYYYIFPKSKLEEEDVMAIHALENAEKRALNIAKALGFDEIEIISIDDVTGSKSGFRRYRNIEKREFSNYGRDVLNKNYYLNVTYKLK